MNIVTLKETAGAARVLGNLGIDVDVLSVGCGLSPGCQNPRRGESESGRAVVVSVFQTTRSSVVGVATCSCWLRAIGAQAPFTTFATSDGGCSRPED
jgi:hypothetical protein